MFKRLLWALFSLLISSQVVYAQQVLFLAPTEVVQGGDNGQTYVNLAYNAFAADPVTVGLGGVRDGRGWLSNSTALNANIFDGIKVVVLTTTYAQINPAQIPVIRAAMLNRPDLTFVMFPDGCCQSATNLTPIVNIIKEGTGWGLTQTPVGGTIASPLNTNSLYDGSFSALNPLRGNAYQLINNVPADHALYLANGTVAMPAPGTLTSAYGLFVPQQGFNNGQGACLFVTADISPFVSAGQPALIASSFMNAATDPAGACKQPTRAPDLTPTLTGPTALTAGTPATFALTLTNNGATDSTNGAVSVTLPAGMTVDAASLPIGCSVGAPGIVCANVGTIASGGTRVINFTATPTQALPAGTTIGVAVTGVTGETNTANNNTALGIAAVTPPDLSTSVTVPAMTAGQPATITLNVTNNGGTASSDGSATLQVPAGVTIDATSLPTGCTASGQTVTCLPGAIAPGASASFPIVVTPSSPGPVTFNSDVTGVTGETVTGNNAGSAAGTVAPAPPDLTTTITVPPMIVGQDATITLQVANVGGSPGAATSATLTVPAGTTIVSVPAGCTFAGQVVTCAVGVLNPAASAPFAIVVRSDTAGAAVFSSNVNAVAGETNAANNASTQAGVVSAAAAGVQAVPTLDWLGLIALTGLLPLLALLARRRRPG